MGKNDPDYRWKIMLTEQSENGRINHRVTYVESDKQIPETVRHMQQLFGSELMENPDYSITVEYKRATMADLFG